ncbi:MAG TPA: sulfotransferase, partial [Alphaproteobacteria bacterium]|nr:sulfotransferase [Alphaproteobacteria bacterium]
SKSDENLGEMLNLYKDNDLIINDKSELSFTIAKAYEDLGDYEKSFKYFDQANKLKNNNKYNFSREEKLFRNIKKFFDSNEFNKNKKNFDNRKIIFICGMPRSGTTLVEQILSSHNKIFGAGELNFLRQVTTKFFVLEDKLNNQKIIEEINSSNNILNIEYYKLINYLKIKESIITDKAPQNYIWIGFIKYFFPNAKIIHCCRNKKDVLLSIYKNNFSSSDMDWSYDPRNIVRYYNLYLDLIKFWKYKFEKFIYDLSYEKLVTDSENQIKKLLEYCSLEWDKNCLNHNKYSKTAIQTVSISQARKPIYKSSVNSSEIYSKYLDNYFKLLDN